MDKETRRETLTARFKSSFHSDDVSEELKMYSCIMSEEYFWRQEDEMMFPPVRNSNNPKFQQELSSQ